MSEYTTGNGIWNGWYWRFLVILVVVVAALEVAAYVFLHYPIVTSLPLALVVVAYMTAPRVKERRLANTLAGVLAAFVLSLILEFAFDFAQIRKAPLAFAETDLFALAMGLMMGYLYLRLTMWAERKREELENKRREQLGQAEPRPVRRHHKKKKRKR